MLLWLKFHKKTIVISGLALATIVAAVMGWYFMNQKEEPTDGNKPSSSTAAETDEPEVIEESVSEKESEEPEKEEMSEKEEESQKEEQTEKKEQVDKKENTSNPPKQENKKTEPEKAPTKDEDKTDVGGQQVVQTANTSTGISWDGKSPIVYTYPDGTTGTIPQEGATYEVVPGYQGTFHFQKDSVGRIVEWSVCETCGKKVGCGKDDTCSQMGSNGYCHWCGEQQTAYVCHTCIHPDEKGYCERCGKIEGDGLNGTCVSFWARGGNCPSCGKYLGVNECHTCDD